MCGQQENNACDHRHVESHPFADSSSARRQGDSTPAPAPLIYYPLPPYASTHYSASEGIGQGERVGKAILVRPESHPEPHAVSRCRDCSGPTPGGQAINNFQNVGDLCL